MYEAALILSVVIYIATLMVFLRDPTASIFHPATFYLMFHGLVFVVRPVTAWFFEYRGIMYSAMHFTPTVGDKVEALICTNLALVVFVGVSMLLVPERLTFKQDSIDIAERPALFARFLPVAFGLGLIGIYSMIWLLDYSETGEGYSELDLYTGARAMTATNGYFFTAGFMLASITAIIAYLGRFTLWSMAPFVMFAVYRFATGQRGPVITAAVMIALLYMYDRRRHWPTFAVVAAALMIIPAFDAIRDDRGARLRAFFGYELADEDYVRTISERDEAPLESMDIGMLEMVEFVTWSIPEKSGSYDYFLGNLQVLTEPIPRVLWPEKPVGQPIKLFNLYSHAIPINGVMSVPGMGWIYWGFPGVAIWATVFALIYGTGYKVFLRGSQSNIAVLGYVIFLSTAVVAYRDGLILTILKQLLFYMAPLVALVLVCRVTGLPAVADLRRQWKTRDLRSAEPEISSSSRGSLSTGRQTAERTLWEGPRARRRALASEVGRENVARERLGRQREN